MQKQNRNGVRGIETHYATQIYWDERQPLFGYIRHEHIFSLVIHFRYVDQTQMEQNILKTIIGMTFIEKVNILSWEVTSDTCGTKIDSTNSLSFKER